MTTPNQLNVSLAPQKPWTPPAPLDSMFESASPKSDLTDTEQKRLEASEKIISNGCKSMFSMGTALQIIRDHKLYRNLYSSFEDYCRIRWGFGRSHINRHIGAAHVVQVLAPIGSKIESESVARPLVGLTDDQIVNSYQAAQRLAGGKPITAKIVRQAAAEFKSVKLITPEATENCTEGGVFTEAATKLIARIGRAIEHDSTAKALTTLDKLIEFLQTTKKSLTHEK